ncbi:MAG: helicase-associated domain-containing protein, partial [Armatimonadetes bacterium]|nr:helicase-associated domain-containing protein [Armatimonadota bacterium]
IVPATVAVLHAIGVLDLGLHRRTPVACRLSPLGACAFGKAPRSSPPERILVVNPDFEVILLPEGAVDDLLYQLDGFCEREKQDRTFHLRITKASVERAAADGLGAEDMLGLLRAHSRTELPQNVVFSIEGWARGVRLASLHELCLLETSDSATMDLICQLPELRNLVLKRITPTAAALTAHPGYDKAVSALRRLGVYLRDSSSL